MPSLQLIPGGQLRSWITLILSEFLLEFHQVEMQQKGQKGGSPRGQLACLVQSVPEENE